jgi:hypothetical protein
MLTTAHKEFTARQGSLIFSTAQSTAINGMSAPCGVSLKRLSFIALLPGLLFSTAGQAAFTLNFAGGVAVDVGNVGPNQAAPESVIDPSNGLRYWHYIVGDPATGFAQEVYIQATGSSCPQSTICSASGGSVGFGSVNVMNSGPGTGNPNDILIREVMGGTWNATTSTWTCDTSYCDEFVKGAYADKPKMTQGINDPDFTSNFVLDMSNIAISNNSTAITLTDGSTAPTGSSLTNVQTVLDPNSSSTFAFDMAHDAQLTNVNGGKYTYTTGSGVLGANGHYVYVDGSFDPTTLDYSPFLDPTVNNPWSFPAGKP